MRPDEPDINRADVEENHGNQPVAISPDIEHKSVIANVIHRIKSLSKVGQIAPISHLHYLVPSVQRLDSIRVE